MAYPLGRSWLSEIVRGVICVFCLFVALTTSAQEVWESFGTSSSPWGVSSDLTTITNTTYKVNVINRNQESAENKQNNTWSTENIWINTTSFKDVPMDISFTVESIIPEHKTNYFRVANQWYWKVKINYTTSSGQDKYFALNFNSEPSEYGTYLRQSSCTSDNGAQSTWYEVTSRRYRTFNVIFDDDEIRIYDDDGEHLAKTIYGVKALRYVQVGASNGTELAITNTSCRKKTVYGRALPYLSAAANYLKNDNPSAAASEVNKAISKGLKCFDTYFVRGLCYIGQEYYKSAIEDFTAALSYPSENKENAYYQRGICKLLLDDDSGIDDLKRGGQDGIVFLREHDLLDYKPGQKKTTSTSSRSSSRPKQNSGTTSGKKPILKK